MKNRTIDIEHRPTDSMSAKQKSALDRLWNRLLQPKANEKAPEAVSTGTEARRDRIDVSNK